jgi:hypothetical protein
VNKSQKEKSCDQGIKIKEDIDSISRLSLKDSVYVADISAKGKNSIIEKVSIIKAKDKEAVSVVTNYKGNEKVINNSKKVFNMFNNNKNKDYKKSSKNKNIISKNKKGLDINEVNSSNNKKELSKVNISESNNKDCTKTSDNSKEVSIVKSNKNIDKRGSRQKAENNKSNNKSKNMTDNNKIRKRVRKQKVWPTFKNR